MGILRRSRSKGTKTTRVHGGMDVRLGSVNTDLSREIVGWNSEL